MRILGVDPGTWKTGVGVIETQGSKYQLVYADVIAVKDKHMPLAERLLQIHRSLSECVAKYRPDVLSLENVFFGKDVTAMVKVGEARACAMLAAAQHGVEVVEYPPARVKQAVTGNGRAVKEQMQHMIKTLLGFRELPAADCADALANAICHIHFMHARKLEKVAAPRKMTFEDRVKLALRNTP